MRSDPHQAPRITELVLCIWHRARIATYRCILVNIVVIYIYRYHSGIRYYPYHIHVLYAFFPPAAETVSCRFMHCSTFPWWVGNPAGSDRTPCWSQSQPVGIRMARRRHRR